MKPILPGNFRISVCGPTVYNYIHIGNARPVVVFDTLRRYLEYRGNKVRFCLLYTSNEIVRQEIDGLKKIGVDVETNVVIGRTLTIDELFEMGNEAVFIGSGAGLPRFMGIPGDSLNLSLIHI